MSASIQASAAARSAKPRVVLASSYRGYGHIQRKCESDTEHNGEKNGGEDRRRDTSQGACELRGQSTTAPSHGVRAVVLWNQSSLIMLNPSRTPGGPNVSNRPMEAAECARAIQISHDPHRKAVLSNLQQMWIALANERAFLSPERLAREAESIGRLHCTLTERDTLTHH